MPAPAPVPAPVGRAADLSVEVLPWSQFYVEVGRDLRSASQVDVVTLLWDHPGLTDILERTFRKLFVTIAVRPDTRSLAGSKKK